MQGHNYMLTTHFGFAQLSSPTRVSGMPAFMWKWLAYCSHFMFKSGHKHTHAQKNAISAHYRVLCPLAQMENLRGDVSILIPENQRLCIQNVDLITGRDLERQCLQSTIRVQCFQCAWGSRVYPQPVPAKESWGLFQSCTLTSSTLINHSTVGLVANHSAGTPVCWMGLFLEVDLPQEIGAICLKR